MFREAYDVAPHEDILFKGLKKIKAHYKMTEEIQVGQDQNRDNFVELVHTELTPINQTDKEGNHITQPCTYLIWNLIRKVKKGQNCIFTVCLGNYTRVITEVKVESDSDTPEEN